MAAPIKIDSTLATMSSSKQSIMASVENFKSSVLRIRDILRGPGVSITGMDSMRHICLYLLSRYITRSKVHDLEVPEEFAWENLIETAQTKNGGLQKALDYFYHKEEDSLVNHFDRLFGTDKFSFDVKNPQKHKEILEILNGVNMEDVDCQMDILGWVYEQHLKTGSSAARDLGQFFTDRFICSYMVKLCSPKFKSPGVPESVCDPSMGTGGFLTAYIKYFKETYPEKPINWAVQQKEIHGCDTDPKVAGVSRLNLFMESGGHRFENLLTHDSLYGDLPLTGYDIILANMPFGLKGIVHASCCKRVNELKIRGTKSEPLFLQLMMLSLKRGGRCAVVVPDGMLVNTSTLHNGTRKYLLDNFNLKRVIKMKGQFFMNTSIQPTILFFENTGKATEAVEFWDVLANDKGAITETMILSVPRTKFDASSSFDLRRYQETEKLIVNSVGFPTVKLSEIATLKQGFPFKSSDYVKDGLSVLKHNNLQNGIVKPSKEQDYVMKSNTTTDYLLKKDDIVVSMDFDCGKIGKIVSDGWILNQRMCLVRANRQKVIQSYLYYQLLIGNFHSDMTNINTGTTIKHITGKNIADANIILPPLEIQNQIVATLDRIYAPGTTELSDTLKMTNSAMDLVLANPGGATLEPIVEAQRLIRKSAQMVADVKAQMVAVVKASITHSKTTYKFADIMSYIRGFTFKPEHFKDNGFPILKVSNLKDGYVSEEKLQFTDENTIYKKYLVEHNDIILVITGSSTGNVAINQTKMTYYLNQNALSIKANKKIISQMYMYYWMRFGYFSDKVKNMSSGSAQPFTSQKDIDAIECSIPSLEVQTETLSYLNDLQTQLTSLENLQKQSERNAKFILDSYLNTTQ